MIKNIKNYPISDESKQHTVHHAEVYRYEDNRTFCEGVILSIKAIDTEGFPLETIEELSDLEYSYNEMSVNKISKELKR